MANFRYKFQLFYDPEWKVSWPKFGSQPTICGHLYRSSKLLKAKLQVRGHQHGAHGRQVTRTDHVGGLQVCSDNSVNMISVFTWTPLIFINDNLIED